MLRGLVLACVPLLPAGSLAAQCGEQLLKATYGHNYEDFGEAVALSGPLAVIGAPGQPAGGSTVAGAAYLFQDFGTEDGYVPIGEISPYGSALGLFAYTYSYGADVAVDGDLVAIGAPGTAVVVGETRGAVFLWEHNGFTWAVSEMLVSATSGQKGFGATVALSGDTLVTSTYFPLRQVHVFERIDGVWTNTAVLDDPTPTGLSTDFGTRLAIDGDTIVASAQNFGTPSPTKGAVYVFERGTGGNWSLDAMLEQPEVAGSFTFGESVAISGDRLAVGNYHVSDGHAVIFRRAGGSWVHEQTLLQPGGGGWVGGAIAIDGDRLAVGGQSACFSSQWDDAGWADLLEVFPSQEVVLWSHFGDDVDVDGDHLLVGDPKWKEWKDFVGGKLVEPGAAFLHGFPKVHGILVEILAGLRLADGTLLVDEPIGDIAVEPDSDDEHIAGMFLFEPGWAQLDACYDFRWVNVLVGEHVGGEPVDEDEVVGLLPAIDPTPVDGPEPYYFNATIWELGSSGPTPIHVEGLHSTFSDSPADYPEKGVVLRFETYLVARDLTVGELAPQAFNVLGGFTWAYHSFANESYPCDVLAPSVSSIAAALANGLFPGHAGYPGFPGWTPTVGHDLFACPPLSGDPQTASAAGGGTQDLELNAGLNYAALVYLLLGSTSGTEPGIPLGPHVLPLVSDDAYFKFTLLHPNSVVLQNSLGALDEHGHASAAFQLPVGSSAALVGLVAHHAYAVIDGSVVLLTSNPVAVTIVP
jgi:hypothetical protein